MKTCPSCGQRKPNYALRCPACDSHDPEIVQLTVGGTPGLTLLIIAMLLFWLYRFWRIGLAAWSGNLRLAAFAAMGIGAAALVSGAMWTFGIRSRKQGMVLLAVGLVAYLILQLV